MGGGENKLQWYNGEIDDMSISDNGIRNMNRVFLEKKNFTQTRSRHNNIKEEAIACLKSGKAILKQDDDNLLIVDSLQKIIVKDSESGSYALTSYSEFSFFMGSILA